METLNQTLSSPFAWVVYLVMYLFVAYCFMVIAGKLHVPNGWLAFIPIANIYLYCKMIRISGWYMLLQFVPIVNIIFIVYLYWNIFERREYAGALSLLMLVPIADLIVPAVVAFRDRHVPGGPTPAAR